MNTTDLLRTLLPPLSYDPNGENLSAELHAEARALDDVQRSGLRVLGSVTPFYAFGTLSDWARVYAVPFRSGATFQERRDNVLTKMAATGGLSRRYFINLAATMGYHITITEPRAFRTGVNRCGDMLYTEDIRWTWQVNVFGSHTPRYRFRTGASMCGEPLLSFGEARLESTFKDLKPAFTDCYFVYLDEVINAELNAAS